MAQSAKKKGAEETLLGRGESAIKMNAFLNFGAH